MEASAPDSEDLRMTALRQALIDGENSGQSKPFDPEAFLAEMYQRFEADS